MGGCFGEGLGEEAELGGEELGRREVGWEVRGAFAGGGGGCRGWAGAGGWVGVGEGEGEQVDGVVEERMEGGEGCEMDGMVRVDGEGLVW